MRDEFARQGAEIDALYARIVRRGGTHKCTGCGHEVRSACDCGRAYIATGPHAESESEMSHENRHENRHEWTRKSSPARPADAERHTYEQCRAVTRLTGSDRSPLDLDH